MIESRQDDVRHRIPVEKYVQTVNFKSMIAKNEVQLASDHGSFV